jgi:murein L,D-transpeptidase YcbB/YkuD
MGTKTKILLIITLLSTMAFATTKNESNVSEPISFEAETKTSLKEVFSKKNSDFLKKITHKKFLKSFYRKNNYQSLWLDKDGLKQKKYKVLISNIENDLTLDNQGYIAQHTQQIQQELENNLSKKDLYKLEVSLSSLYYDFLSHALYGEIEWKNFERKLRSLKRQKINAEWIKTKPAYKISTLLLQDDINATLTEIRPKNFGYDALYNSLNKLYKMKVDGGWEKLGYFKRLELGSSGAMVIKLRERLTYSGDYVECNSTKVETIEKSDDNQSKEPKIDKKAIFDECLDVAVKKFQKRHGLVVDGVVGAGTRKVLNISVDEKIKTVLLNLDRIKWLPRTKEERYLIVNIPEFMLYYIEDKQLKKSLRVIVGDKRHPTPIFNEKISYIVLNPYWKVPEGIVKREIVPHMIKNPNYLRRQGLQAHRTWNENSPIVNVSNLSWENYLTGGLKFPYRLMQPPGPRNALGKIKFKFPNRFAVYLHDTPTRYLFKRTVRAFSHGCVRLSNPEQLLATISTFNKDINLTKATKILKGKRKVQLNVKNKLPIHLVYLTAGVNDNNELEFRNDIYRYDKFTKRVIR